MGRALKVSILATLLAAALLAFACGKSHVAGRASLEPANSPQSLDDAQAQLDALACPKGVKPELWAQLKAALESALSEDNSTGTPRSLARLVDKADEPGWLARRTHKLASSPPTGEANRVNDLAIADNGDGTYTLTWHYRNLGDYDQNGAVAVEDIIPLAQHFGATWASGEENTLPAVIDGSGNGRVGIEDITPLAANIGANVDHYAIEGAQAQDGTWEAVAEVAQNAGAGDGRLAFEYALADTPFRWYHAVPADTASTSGESSNAVFSPAFNEWVHTWGGSDSEKVRAIAVDSDQDIYAVGYVDYGSGARGLLFIKCSSTGKLLWQNTWNVLGLDTGYAAASDVAIDVNGDVYISGGCKRTSDDTDNALLLKCTAEGELLWQKAWGSAEDAGASAITLDDNGNVYILGGTGNGDAWSYDIIILKYSPAGDLLWQKTWGRGGFDAANGIVCDSNGCIYITGHTRDAASGKSGALLLKFASDGTLLWQKAWGSTSYETATDIAIDADNCIYVVGRTAIYEYGGYGDAFILKLTDEGTLLWQEVCGGTCQDTGYSILTSNKGTVYVAGYFSPLDIRGYGLLLEYSPDGILLNQRSWDNPPGVVFYSLCEGKQGLLYVAGTGFTSNGSWASADLNSVLGSGTLHGISGNANDLTGTQSPVAGIMETVNGIEDEGGGYTDALIMKIDPFQW